MKTGSHIIILVLLPFLSYTQCILEVVRLSDTDFTIQSTGFEISTPNTGTSIFQFFINQDFFDANPSHFGSLSSSGDLSILGHDPRLISRGLTSAHVQLVNSQGSGVFEISNPQLTASGSETYSINDGVLKAVGSSIPITWSDFAGPTTLCQAEVIGPTLTEIEGSALISGSGELNQSSTGSAHLLPVAYGSVCKESFTGDPISLFDHTSNVSITEGAGYVDVHFDANIAGDVVMSVSPIDCSVSGPIGTQSIQSVQDGNTIRVTMYTPNGSLVGENKGFSFVAYKR